MSRYTTRVELHAGTSEDYETLHAAMEGKGFSRTITASDGVAYYLPTAEYNYDGTLTRDEVFEAAKRAAAQTGNSYAVLVTESAGRSWVGLQSVKKTA
jgi:hypothetical protein